MFKAKQLEKLVKAGIISADQQKQILAFNDRADGGFVMRALNLLGIFTIGIGVISLVAANWEYLSNNLKLVVMFVLLFGAAGEAVLCKRQGQDNKAEKWLVALFMLVGAAIGLVIQVYQLSGGKIHLPLAFWCAVTLPLLFVAKKKYVAWFWAPLFLTWCAIYYGDRWKNWFDWYGLEILFGVYAVIYAGGRLLNMYKPDFVAGSVLRRDACFAFYLVFAIYILWCTSFHLVVSALILLVTSFIYQSCKEYRLVRLNIKFAGLWVFCLYIYLGYKIGLFSTGIGLILSGVVLILLLKGVTKWAKLVKGGEKNA